MWISRLLVFPDDRAGGPQGSGAGGVGHALIARGFGLVAPGETDALPDASCCEIGLAEVRMGGG